MLTNFEQEEIWRKDSNNWKYGLFYCNKEDQRIFVEKRNPLYGVTFNFAHQKSYYYLIGIVLFFGFIIFAITYLAK